MSNLNIYLPPFAPDYSGCSSALYELGGMIVLHDASGCTGNVLGYDEPRWQKADSSRALVYCSAYRHMEAVLGLDDQVNDRIIQAAESLKPKFIALVGSPVPMLVGTDYNGIAKQLEAKTGIPSFGFDTKGLEFYDNGYMKATNALIERYARKEKTVKRSINLLGLNPIDFGNRGNDKAIISLIKKNGIKINCSFSMNFTLEDIKKAGASELNVVLSEGGYEVALFMKKKFGIPFITSLPFSDGKMFLEEINAALENREVKRKDVKKDTNRRVLIIGEQVSSNALRKELEDRGLTSDVAILFSHRPELLNENDYSFVQEKDIVKIINSGTYTDIVADPLIKQLLRKEDVRFHEMASVAVSSKFHWDEVRPLLGDEMEAFLSEIANIQ